MRLSNEAADVRDYRVRATHASHGGEPATAFFTEIAGLVDADHDPWKSFSETVADAVQMRAQHLRVRRYCDRPYTDMPAGAAWSGTRAATHPERERAMRIRCSAVVAALAAGVLCGCASQMTELQHVAKDWCMVIRASQVMPIYPLTEDVQPGDVFLVQVPIEEETRVWHNKGFLPLPQMLVRLHGMDFDAFYQAAYWEGTYAPNGGHKRPWPGVVHRDPETGQFVDVRAPRAAFPTYTVKVKTGVGLRMAIPIKGVPFAMSLMDARSANVAVTLSDAYSYGLDNEEILERVRAWADLPETRTLLADLYAAAPSRWCRGQKDAYLRVVTRVFLVSAVQVEATRDEAFAAGADVGVPRPFNLPEIRDKETAQNYQTVLRILSDTMKSEKAVLPAPEAGGEAAPAAKEAELPVEAGGSVRIAFATGRTVGMDQKFDRPLGIGYLGFDLPILKEGALGVPVATFQRITNPSSAPNPRFTPVQQEYQMSVKMARQRLGPMDPDHRRVAVIAVVDRLAPAGMKPDAFDDVRKMADELDTALKAGKDEEAGRLADRLLNRFFLRLHAWSGSDKDRWEQTGRALAEVLRQH